MKIKDIKASIHQYSVTLPMINKPLEQRHFVFCEVETDEGIRGCGITGAFLPWAVVTTLENDMLSICGSRVSTRKAMGSLLGV